MDWLKERKLVKGEKYLKGWDLLMGSYVQREKGVLPTINGIVQL